MLPTATALHRSAHRTLGPGRPARTPSWVFRPIRHHPTAVSPSTFQHVVEQVVVAGSVISVDLVVRRHHGAGLRPLDDDLERQQVRLAVRVGIDDRVQPVPIGFVAVQREVFRRRNDTLLLNPDDRLRGHRGTQQRVLGKVLEVAAVTRVARQIDCAGQLHVEPATARLPADRFARGPGQHRVKAGR